MAYREQKFCSEFRKLLIEERRKASAKAIFRNEAPAYTLKEPHQITESSLFHFAKFFIEKKISDKADFVEIFDLAAAFKLQELKETCLKVLHNNSGRYDTLELFNLGHFHYCEELKKMAFEDIQRMFPDLRDEYIKAPNTINLLMSSAKEIDSFMPEELKKKLAKQKLKCIARKVKELISKKTT